MENNLQLIDIKVLNSLANDDADFKKELIRIFLDQIPGFVENMNQFYKENDFEKLGREAHTAKSSVLIFGMTNTGHLLKEIQTWSENKKFDDIGPALNQVVLDLNNAQLDLQKLIKEL